LRPPQASEQLFVAAFGEGARLNLGKLRWSMRRATRIELWLVKVTEEGPLGVQAASVLLASDRSTADPAASDRDRGSLVARAAIARLVAARTRVDPAMVAIEHDARGRPYFRDHPALHVSLSYGGEFVACAVSRRGVGVDIERADRPEADEQLVARICTPGERRMLELLPEHARRRAVVRLWARKEAVVKALGVGLAFPLDRLDVSNNLASIAGLPGSEVSVRDVDSGLDDYVVAVSGEGRRLSVRARIIIEESLRGVDAAGRRSSGARPRNRRDQFG
jgi:4'-phosphopantetheinyl transferase